MTISKGKTLMTEGTIWKKIVFFALPILLGNLFQQMYNTVDSLIVGNYLGSNALAAVSSAGNLIFLMVGFFDGLSVGAGVVIARYFGARDLENLETSVHTTVVLGLIASIALTIGGVLFTPTLLTWMGTPENVMPDSVTYFRIFFMGSLGLVMYNALVGILRAVGDSRHPLYYLIISSVVNVILDLVFIAVFHMGVEGAALATALSQVLSAILCLIQLLNTDEEYKIEWKKIRCNWKMLKQIIYFGLPSGMQNSIIAFANVIVQSYINSFGELAMAGCGTYSKIEGFAFLPITSFTMALTTFVSQNLGAKEYERTKKGVRFGVICAVLLAELIGVITFVFAPQLVAAFDSTPAVVKFGVDRARVEGFFFCFLAFSHGIAAVLRGAGKSVIPMVVMMIFWCGVRVSFLAVTMSIHPMIELLYWVYPLTWALSSIAFYIYYKKADWIHALG